MQGKSCSKVKTKMNLLNPIKKLLIKSGKSFANPSAFKYAYELINDGDTLCVEKLDQIIQALEFKI